MKPFSMFGVGILKLIYRAEPRKLSCNTIYREFIKFIVYKIFRKYRRFVLLFFSIINIKNQSSASKYVKFVRKACNLTHN